MNAMLKIIIAGDRNWVGPEIEERLTRFLRCLPLGVMILHGGCRGVDLTAEAVAQKLGIPTQVFLPDWSVGLKGGPLRNQLMLDQGVAGVYLFHQNLSQSKGTLDMCNRAKGAGVPTFLIQ